MIFAHALTEGFVIKDFKEATSRKPTSLKRKKTCLKIAEPQHQPDTVPEQSNMKKNLAALHTQIIVCSHVTVASVLFSGTQLVPHTNQHSLKSRNHKCTKYHFLYILGMLDAEIAAWNVACEIATDPAYKSMC